MSSKIHLAVDQHGQASKIVLSAGHRSDYSAAAELLNGLKADVLLADKGYDADWLLIQAREECGIKQIVIPARSRGKNGPRRDYDKVLYKDRNKVERYFCRLKEWRRVLTRFDKIAANFMAFVQIAAAIINYSLTVNRP